MENRKVEQERPKPQQDSLDSKESLAEHRPDVVKLFVGGLSGDITHDVMLKYFRQFGDVLEAFVIYEKRRPSGFGFINVVNQQVADNILSQKHQINKSRLDVKPAVDRSSAKVQGLDEKKKKIFVGGLPKNFPDEDLQAYFQQYGTVQRCYVAKNPITGKTRGFGFVVFEEEDSVSKAFAKVSHIIGGQEVHLKIATDKSEREASTPGNQDLQSEPKKKTKQHKHQKQEEDPQKTIPDPKHPSISSLPSSNSRQNADPNEIALQSEDLVYSKDAQHPTFSQGLPTKKEKPIMKKLTLKDQPESARNSKKATLSHESSSHIEAKTFSKTESTAPKTAGNSKLVPTRTLLSKPSAETQFDTPSFMGRPSPIGVKTDTGYPTASASVYSQSGPTDLRLSHYTMQHGTVYPMSKHHSSTHFGFQNEHQPYHQPKRKGKNYTNHRQSDYWQGHNHTSAEQQYYSDYNSTQFQETHVSDAQHYLLQQEFHTQQVSYNDAHHPRPNNNQNIHHGHDVYPTLNSAPDDYSDMPPAQRTYQYPNQWTHPYPYSSQIQPVGRGNIASIPVYHPQQLLGQQLQFESHYTDNEPESNIVRDQPQQVISEDSQSGNPSGQEMGESGGNTGDGNLGQQTNHPSFDSGENPQNTKPLDIHAMQLNSGQAVGPGSTSDQHFGFAQRAAAVSQVKTMPNSLNNTPTKTPRSGRYRNSAAKEFHRGASREIPSFVIYEHPVEENNPDSNLLGAIEEVEDPAQEKALESAQRVIDAGTPMSGRFARPLNHQSSTEAHKPAEEDDETNKNLSPGGVDLRQAFALNRAAIYIMMTGRNAISGAEREGPQPIAVRNTQSSIQMETKLDVLDMMLSMRDDPNEQQDQHSHHEGTLKSEGEASSNKQLSARSPDGHPNRSDSPFKAMPQFKFHQSSALVISVTEQAKLDSQIPKSTAEIGFSGSSGNLDRQPRYKENPFVPGEAEDDGSSEENLQRAEDI